MLKYSIGQEFKTNRETAFPKEYGNLEKGATFKIKIAMEECEYGNLEYPYLVVFENGFEVSLDEKDIETLTEEKINITCDYCNIIVEQNGECVFEYAITPQGKKICANCEAKMY